jgi:putative transposase
MQHEQFRRRRLPHWDLPGATYFVTCCLAGSIPARGLLRIGDYRIELSARPRPHGMSERDWIVHKAKLLFALVDGIIDREPAVRLLKDPRLASIVRDSIYYFAGERYDVHAYVVMPSHLHWVFRPRETWADELPPGQTPREQIMHSLKRHTALACNRILGRPGTFWQDESDDHCVRDEDELERIIQYVERNPVQAGLCSSAEEWAFSSARDRGAGSFGAPLVKPHGVGQVS